MIDPERAAELRLQRLRERSHARRLSRDIARYGQFYPTLWINRQLAAWRKDFAETARRLTEIERELERAAP